MRARAAFLLCLILTLSLVPLEVRAEDGTDSGVSPREVADYAMSWVGKISYRLGAREELHEGGESDCSWFLFHIFNHFGLLDEWQKSTTWGSGNVPETVRVDRIEDAIPGDVLFWTEGFEEDGTPRGHVVMYVGALQVVGCNGSSPTTGSVSQSYYTRPGGGREPDAIWRMKALDGQMPRHFFGCTPADTPVDGHLYLLLSSKNPEKLLFVKKKKGKVQIKCNTFSGSSRGVFLMTALSDGSWRLSSDYTGGVMAVNGSDLTLSGNKESASGRFRILSNSDGTVSLRNMAIGDSVVLRKENGKSVVKADIPRETDTTSFFLVDVSRFYKDRTSTLNKKKKASSRECTAG